MVGSHYDKLSLMFHMTTHDLCHLWRFDKSDILCMISLTFIYFISLTRISLASFLSDLGKQHSPRCDAAECGVPSGAMLFA